MTHTGTDDLHVSVVVCTRNRPDLIAGAVQSILGNPYPAFDLLVVDQSTTAATREQLQPFMGDRRFRYLHTDTVGLSLAGNIGIANTHGDVVAFTDDDCLVAPDWVERIASTFKRDNQLGGLFGKVEPAPQYAGKDGWLPVFDIAASTTIRAPRRAPVTGPMGANMAFRRRVLTAIHGFDTRLGPGAPLRSAGDIDAFYRTLLTGSAMRLAHDVVVQHLGYRDYASGEGGKLICDSLFANGAYYTKHIRARDVTMTRVFLKDLGGNLWSAAENVLRGRRPVGIRRPLMLIYGSVYSLRFPVDRRRRLFAQGSLPS